MTRWPQSRTQVERFDRLDLAAAGLDPDKAIDKSQHRGLGRFGGIAGSFLVAELCRRNLSFTQIFTTVAVPGLISAVALLVKQFAHPEDKSAYVAKGEALGH